MNKIICGDCIDVMKSLEADSIDTLITDPPYGLSFMGKKWDYDVPGVETWKECLRVLKPGGTALIFAGSRTQHRMAVAVEDAGFILKDCIMWLYGSGFPKATDISKQLDKKAGVEREVIGKRTDGRYAHSFQDTNNPMGQLNPKKSNVEKIGQITEPSTPEAKIWNGWKSHGLKPAYEPILVAMKPNDGTYANNAIKHGVSGLNIDGGRIGTKDNLNGGTYSGGKRRKVNGEWGEHSGFTRGNEGGFIQPKGRFPANIILDEEAAKLLDEQSGDVKGGRNKTQATSIFGSNVKDRVQVKRECDSGGASRFFYVAKASKKERNAGCEGLEEKDGIRSNAPRESEDIKTPLRANNHPTVKPIALMEYLCKLTKTPTGGVVLDPFMGSGTTGLACQNTGRDFIGIEKEPEYVKIAEARLKHNIKQKKLL